MDKLPKKPCGGKCYEFWKLDPVTYSEQEDNLQVQLQDFHAIESWYDKKLEWIPLDNVAYEFEAWASDRTSRLKPAVDGNKSLKPIKLHKMDEEDLQNLKHGENYKYSLTDGNHRSALLCDMGYTHILAYVTCCRTDPPVVDPEEDRSELLNVVLKDAALSKLKFVINEGNVLIGSFFYKSENGNEDASNFKQARETSLGNKCIGGFSFLPKKDLSENSLSVTDVILNTSGESHEDMFTITVQLLNEKHVLKGNLKKLQKDVGSLIKIDPRWTPVSPGL